MPTNLNRYLVGDAAKRNDSISGLDPTFVELVEQLYNAAPDHIREKMQISSGYRSNALQKQLYDEALRRYGPQEVRRWVAPPGRSPHNKGKALDFNNFKDPNNIARQWVHDNAKKYKLHFPLQNEAWHMEPINKIAATQNLPLNVPMPPRRPDFPSDIAAESPSHLFNGQVVSLPKERPKNPENPYLKGAKILASDTFTLPFFDTRVSENNSPTISYKSLQDNEIASLLYDHMPLSSDEGFSPIDEHEELPLTSPHSTRQQNKFTPRGADLDETAPKWFDALRALFQ